VASYGAILADPTIESTKEDVESARLMGIIGLKK
jgi:hypothetical protein